MPTYVYRCENGHTFELFHSISDESEKHCPECEAPAKRIPAGGAGLLFKGSGFYITDYRSKGYHEAKKKEGGSSATPPPASGGASGGAGGGSSGGGASGGTSGGTSGGGSAGGGKD